MEKLGYLKKVDKNNDSCGQMARDYRIYKTRMSICIGMLVILLIAANIRFVTDGLWQDPELYSGMLLVNVGIVGMIGVAFLMRNN